MSARVAGFAGAGRSLTPSATISVIHTIMSDQPDFSEPPGKKHSSAHFYILGSIVFLTLSLAATHVFLNRTSVGSQRFINMTFLVYTVTVLVVLALLILATILGRNLIKLYFEKKRGQPGSGFKTKLVMTFIGLSLLPALILFVLAYTIISSSIESWFRDPPAQVMENSRRLIEQYYAEVENQGKLRAAAIARSFRSVEEISGEMTPGLPDRLREICEEYGIGTIHLVDRHGRLTAQSASSLAPDDHGEMRDSLIDTAISGRQGFIIGRTAPDDPWNEISYASAPVRDGAGGIIGAVIVETIRSRYTRIWADAITDAYEKYEQLKLEKPSLGFNVLLILALSTLLIVFAFSWFAMYLAKRITVPIQSLMHGAAEVAAGNLSHRVECRAFDELESLVASFNRMTGDLQENERRIDAVQQNLRRTSEENEDRRRSLETILQNISTGVVALDVERAVRAMNRAAGQMLRAEEPKEKNRIEEIVPAPAGDTLRSLLDKAEVLGTVAKNIELAFPDKSLQIAAKVTPLVDANGHREGWVMVLDDMTELIK
ncbi:MAG TPA: HAMP domain-containing protein, partial [Acidobacteriota bacterium]|nr:HAMP domain-containing protein [Acidobacteriota bacterium]